MDDDFDNDDVEMADEDLNESLNDDLGDLGEGTGGDVDVEAEFEETTVVGGTRATGGARANAKMSGPEAVSVRAPRPPAPKAKKAAAPAKKGAVVKAAKKAAPKKKAAAKKKAAPKKKKAAPKKKARKA